LRLAVWRHFATLRARSLLGPRFDRTRQVALRSGCQHRPITDEGCARTAGGFGLTDRAVRSGFVIKDWAVGASNPSFGKSDFAAVATNLTVVATSFRGVEKDFFGVDTSFRLRETCFRAVETSFRGAIRPSVAWKLTSEWRKRVLPIGENGLPGGKNVLPRGGYVLPTGVYRTFVSGCET
jgi:hypothetical protein